MRPKSPNQFWGIYHMDREYARELGNPLRTVVEAPSKIAAEEAAAQLGFGDAWAHPITHEQIQQARWLPLRRAKQRQQLARKQSRGIRV